MMGWLLQIALVPFYGGILLLGHMAGNTPAPPTVQDPGSIIDWAAKSLSASRLS